MIGDVMNDVDFDTLKPGNAEDEMKEQKPERAISRCGSQKSIGKCCMSIECSQTISTIRIC